MSENTTKTQRNSCKATDAQKNRMEKAEAFYLRKGFRSFRKLCRHLNVDQSRARKAFLGIPTYGEKLAKKEQALKEKIEKFIEFAEEQ